MKKRRRARIFRLDDQVHVHGAHDGIAARIVSHRDAVRIGAATGDLCHPVSLLLLPPQYHLLLPPADSQVFFQQFRGIFLIRTIVSVCVAIDKIKV